MSGHLFKGIVDVINGTSGNFIVRLNPIDSNIEFSTGLPASDNLILESTHTATTADLIVRDETSDGVIVHGNPVNSGAIFSVPEFASVPTTIGTQFLSINSGGDIGPLGPFAPGSLVGTNSSSEFQSYTAGTNIVLDSGFGTVSVSPTPTFTDVTTNTLTVNGQATFNDNILANSSTLFIRDIQATSIRQQPFSTAIADAVSPSQRYVFINPVAVIGSLIFSFLTAVNTSYTFTLNVVNRPGGSSLYVLHVDNTSGVVTATLSTPVSADGGAPITTSIGSSTVIISAGAAGSYTVLADIVRTVSP